MSLDDDSPLPRPDGVFSIDSDDDTSVPPAPKRRGRPPGSRNSTPRRTRSFRTVVREQVRAIVAIVNTLIVASPYRDDALDEHEMTLLADALEAEAMSHDRIANWLGRVTGVSAHVLLIRACIVIAAPRLARRGLIPNLSGESPAAVQTREDYNDGRNTYATDWAAQFEATVPVAAE